MSQSSLQKSASNGMKDDTCVGKRFGRSLVEFGGLMEITVGISLRTSGDCASSSSFIEDMLYAESWQSRFLEKSHRGRSGRFAIKEQNHEFMATLGIQT